MASRETTPTRLGEQERVAWGLTRRLVEVVNGHRLDLIPEMYADDIVMYTSARDHPIRGHEGMRAYVQGIHAGFPDFRIAIEAEVYSGDTAAVRFHMAGTHTGPYIGLPPTLRVVDTTQNLIFRVRDNRVCEAWQEINLQKAWRQLGLLPPIGGGPLSLLVWAVRTTLRIAISTVRFRRSRPGAVEALEASIPASPADADADRSR